MSQRRGFTLIEVMLAIALTGIVAVLVYGAAGIAMDTEARLVDHDRRLRSARAWQVVIEDGLRNLRANASYPRPTLVVSPGTDPLGTPRDRLEFVTAGGTPPLTGDADWLVTLEATEAGIALTALPIGVRAPARRVVGPATLTGLALRVLPQGDDAEWLAEWSDRQLLPRAIELTFWTDSGPAGPPILLTIPLEFVP